MVIEDGEFDPGSEDARFLQSLGVKHQEDSGSCLGHSMALLISIIAAFSAALTVGVRVAPPELPDKGPFIIQ
jgi:hypothetical protein